MLTLFTQLIHHCYCATAVAAVTAVLNSIVAYICVNSIAHGNHMCYDILLCIIVVVFGRLTENGAPKEENNDGVRFAQKKKSNINNSNNNEE